MDRPRVSVLIPVFNGERYLRQAIDSALRQTCPPHEIIVVDDGSTDASRSIAESFGTSVMCMAQQNLGPSAARNLGAGASTGEWIAFLDADDYWLPDKLEKQIAAIGQHPSADLIYTGRIEVYEDGSIREVPAQSPVWVKEKLRFQNPLYPSSVLARRELLLRHPWTTAFRSSEDWWFFYVFSRESNFVSVAEPTFAYRVHSGSLTHGNWRTILVQAQQVAYTIQKDFHGIERFNLRHRVNCRLFANAAIAAREQGCSGYLQLMLRSLACWPFPDIWPTRYKLFAKMLVQTFQAPSISVVSKTAGD